MARLRKDDNNVTGRATNNFAHGGNNDVDTAAEVLSSSSFECLHGVLVKASASNTGIIYVGKAGVTDGSVDATAGYPLAAGEAIEIEADNVSDIFVIASVANQAVFWIAS